MSRRKRRIPLKKPSPNTLSNIQFTNRIKSTRPDTCRLHSSIRPLIPSSTTLRKQRRPTPPSLTTVPSRRCKAHSISTKVYPTTTLWISSTFTDSNRSPASASYCLRSRPSLRPSTRAWRRCPPQPASSRWPSTRVSRSSSNCSTVKSAAS